MEKVLQLCQCISHSGINYIITFIILFESDIIAFMLKNTIMLFFLIKKNTAVFNGQLAVTNSENSVVFLLFFFY